MYYLEEEKEKLRRKYPQFKFPQWKPNPNSKLELTKWIKEFKKINHLKSSYNYGKKLCKSACQGTKEVRF